ncbi:MAG: DUF4093 domain-containing protein [Ruminococcaceae bacterium]|nr:DUF4093 domain-containing protein [Oscillospiraceae bacterium]
MNHEKLKIPYPIVVEGRYDKTLLASVVEGHILTTEGFGIFQKSEKAVLLRRLTEHSPIIVLTDSDSAGQVIRNHLNAILPKEKLIHLYTPQIKGKERRKSAPSREGFLGVEGQAADTLRTLLAPFAADQSCRRGGITKPDLFNLGLSGRDGAAEKRRMLCEKLSLPKDLTAPALLDALNMLYDRETFLNTVNQNS